MRVLIAGLAGAIAMFVWVSVAHMMTPLGSIGFSQLPNEQAVLSAMKTSIGDKAGFYFFPWVDPNDPKMMEKSAALMKTNPSGLMVYQGPGATADMMPMLFWEFGKEFVQALIAAFLLSLTALAGYFSRVGFVTLIGVSAAIATNVSYWIWYGFPLSYTEAQVVIEVVSAFVAGLAIAALVKPKTA